MGLVLVAGDAIVDRYWHGDVARISPEAPVPVVGIEREEYSAGGARNVAKNLEAMGCWVREVYSRSYKEDPVVKLRVIARGQQVCRLDFDKPQVPIDLDQLDEAAQGCQLAVLSDYGKGALSNIGAVIWRLKRAGCKVLVDPKKPPAARYEGADVLKPNLGELREMMGPWSSEEELEQKVKALQRKIGCQTVLLTRGPAGMTLYNGSVDHIPCEAREVYDVTGAGDTAIAAFAWALSEGKPHFEAAKMANRAAGLAVARRGTAVIGREELA